MDTMNIEFTAGIMTIGGISVADLAAEFGSPLYVYDEEILRRQYSALIESVSWRPFRIRYACKANGNPTILRLLRSFGAHVDVVSPGEAVVASQAGFTSDEMLYTGNSVTNDELAFAQQMGILINMDSVSQVLRYGEHYPGNKVCLRINPDLGAGHHQHVITGGPDSKFGICVSDLDKVRELANRYHLKIVGLHQHIGSGILQVEIFEIAMAPILALAPEFEDLQFVNLGGGLGIPYSPDERPLDIGELGRAVSERFRAFCLDYGRPLRLEMEPGRFLVGPCGILLTRVNTLKRTDRHTFAGTDSGFNHLIRHPLYRSYHHIVNATRHEGPVRSVAVCGNLCESGDLFTHGREIVELREGDILAILDAGAYGYSMSFSYNMRPRPAEVMVSAGKVNLIRRRETVEDLLRLCQPVDQFAFPDR